MMQDEDLEDLDKLFGKNELESNRILSFSRCSDFDRNGPQALIKRKNTESKALMIGSLVDDMINENININDIYHIFNGAKPTATLGKLTNIVLDIYKKVPTEKQVLKLVKSNNFWSNITDENILISKFSKPQFWNYLNDVLVKAKDKILVTTPDYLLAEDLTHILKTHDFSKHIFNRPEHIKIFYQQKFEITYNGVKLRGIIDIVLVDEKEKTVTLIDLKTGKDSGLEFTNSFIKYRYYLQECIYMKSFKNICKQIGINSKRYKLQPFKFLYISKSEKIPIEIEIPERWHKAAIHGFNTSYGYYYKGLNQILEDIKWHLNNKVFDMPREMYETNGNITLNDKFIKLMDE
jgi:hypothetical protein